MNNPVFGPSCPHCGITGGHSRSCGLFGVKRHELDCEFCGYGGNGHRIGCVVLEQEKESLKEASFKKKDCYKPWCGIEKRLCVDCAGSQMDKCDITFCKVGGEFLCLKCGEARRRAQRGQPSDPSRGSMHSCASKSGPEAADKESVKSSPLSRMELIEIAFLSMCKQYDQLGDAIAFLAEQLTSHRLEQEIGNQNKQNREEDTDSN